jgi:rhodanese-related sulfurtransferase
MKTAHDLVVAAKARCSEISVAQATAAIASADAVLDVREPDEFAAGHLPRAVNVPRGLLEFKLSATPELASRDLDIVLYCRSGGRAALAACSLLEMGYTRVRSIEGGYDAWLAQGGEVVQPKPLSFD